jgi:hypothetical protein
VRGILIFITASAVQRFLFWLHSFSEKTGAVPIAALSTRSSKPVFAIGGAP